MLCASLPTVWGEELLEVEGVQGGVDQRKGAVYLRERGGWSWRGGIRYLT